MKTYTREEAIDALRRQLPAMTALVERDPRELVAVVPGTIGLRIEVHLNGDEARRARYAGRLLWYGAELASVGALRSGEGDGDYSLDRVFAALRQGAVRLGEAITFGLLGDGSASGTPAEAIHSNQLV